MFKRVSGLMWMTSAMTLTLASTPAAAQRLGVPAASASASAPARSATYDAVIAGMACKQHVSGRMDCEFRVGQALRFVVNGVGQEDVAITLVQADSVGDYTASVVPLHGCVVVKPIWSDRLPAAEDSITKFAFVSPKTGKVYHTWAACLSATRSESRADVKAETKSDAKPDATKAATKAPETKVVAPVVKPPV